MHIMYYGSVQNKYNMKLMLNFLNKNTMYIILKCVWMDRY